MGPIRLNSLETRDKIDSVILFSHNRIFLLDFKRNMHVCVFSKKCSLGPNCQDQKEQLCRGAVRTSRQT